MPRPAMPAISLLALCMLIFSVDYNIVYVALPDIGAAVGFSAQSLQWVVSAYALGLGGFLLLGGEGVDRVGARRMLLVALALYAVASLAGGLASTPQVLVAARVVQGIGGALLFPATLSLLNTSFADEDTRNKAFAWWGTAGASGAIIGALAGGLLTSWLGWQSVFFVNIPLCAIAMAAALTVLDPDASSPKPQGGFDVAGALCTTVGATALLFGLISSPEAGWRSPRTLTALALGALLLTGFALRQRLARSRSVVTAIAIIFVFQGAINMLHYLFFIHLQNVLGYSAFQASLAFVPMSVAAMLGANRLLPLLLGRFGIRAALFGGMLGVGMSMLVLAATMTAGAPFWVLLPGVVLWGVAAGTLYPAMFVAAGAQVPAGQQGAVSAVAQTSAQLGGAIGLAVLIAIANAGLDLRPGAVNAASQVLSGLQMSALTGGVAVLAAAFLALAYPAPKPQPQLNSA